MKIEKKLQNIYLTYYNLLRMQNLWQAHYQTLLIVFLKEFIELSVNTDMVIKNVKLVKLNTKYVIVFFNMQTLKMI